MKKYVFAAAVMAVSMPLVVNAAGTPVAGKSFNLAGTVSLKSSGACYGIKFKGNGKVDPALQATTAVVTVGANDAVGGTFTWKNDTLMPGETLTSGTIKARVGNTFTLDYNDPLERKMAATALLMSASQNGQFFNVLWDNATIAAYSFKVTVDKAGSKITTAKEVATVNSTEGPCTAAATTTRIYKGPAI